MIAHVLDPIQLPLVEGHRTTGRRHPPMDEGPLQPTVLLVEIVRPAVGNAFIAHRGQFLADTGYVRGLLRGRIVSVSTGSWKVSMCIDRSSSAA